MLVLGRASSTTTIEKRPYFLPRTYPRVAINPGRAGPSHRIYIRSCTLCELPSSARSGCTSLDWPRARFRNPLYRVRWIKQDQTLVARLAAAPKQCPCRSKRDGGLPCMELVEPAGQEGAVAREGATAAVNQFISGRESDPRLRVVQACADHATCL
ncbi:hypothetical protein BDV96DRAFT_116228 [Lophiotrema nucula]|uniref:Uncharacterized protein n=1 Tax=Lophiotrema nucula TaxID=690887 RepID=A0A6A5Z3N9_9PLEO|nr:hypothetical protein BDV96DRAFT_116228 [Lophiotrema nucula]